MAEAGSSTRTSPAHTLACGDAAGAAHSSAVSGPMSPTDTLMSPVSSLLSRRTMRVDTRSSFKSLPIVLGSSSPARARVLREHGVRATILSPGIDEVAAAPAMPPAQLPLCIAQAKAAALAARVSTPSLVITADQLLMDGEDRVYSKPTGEADAVRMLASYGGRALRTVTAVVVLNTETGRSVSGVDVATIHFKSSLATAELSAATLAPALPVPLSTLPTVSARLQRHSVGTAAELAEPPSSAPAASSAAQRALPAWQEAPSTVPVDVLQSCGALCVEHPTIAPHIQLIEGELESVLGMPWRLTSRLLREASGVVAFSWESPDASAADASGAYSSRSADGSVGAHNAHPLLGSGASSGAAAARSTRPPIDPVRRLARDSFSASGTSSAGGCAAALVAPAGSAAAEAAPTLVSKPARRNSVHGASPLSMGSSASGAGSVTPTPAAPVPTAPPPPPALP